jgi:hypothetical protein
LRASLPIRNKKIRVKTISDIKTPLPANITTAPRQRTVHNNTQLACVFFSVIKSKPNEIKKIKLKKAAKLLGFAKGYLTPPFINISGKKKNCKKTPKDKLTAIKPIGIMAFFKIRLFELLFVKIKKVSGNKLKVQKAIKLINGTLDVKTLKATTIQNAKNDNKKGSLEKPSLTYPK